MTRFIVQFPILFVILLMAGAGFAVNQATFLITSDYNTTVIWSGECQPGELLKEKSKFSLKLTCGDAAINTRNRTVILAWLVNEAAPQCEKTREELSGDEQWKCTAGAPTDETTQP